MFEANELRRIIDAATIPLKAMILLGINAALGNTDVADLQTKHLQAEWLNYPRPKTGVNRRCPLWPETAAAVAAAIAGRPAAKAPTDAGCVFLTVRGERCGRIHGQDERAGTKIDMVTREFGKLLDTLQLKRHGLNFYALRHTFATIASGSRDQVAVDAVMGRADQSMAADYRERIDDDRLRAVADVVRSWLWPEAK